MLYMAQKRGVPVDTSIVFEKQSYGYTISKTLIKGSPLTGDYYDAYIKLIMPSE